MKVFKLRLVILECAFFKFWQLKYAMRMRESGAEGAEGPGGDQTRILGGEADGNNHAVLEKDIGDLLLGILVSMPLGSRQTSDVLDRKAHPDWVMPARDILWKHVAAISRAAAVND